MIDDSAGRSYFSILFVVGMPDDSLPILIFLWRCQKLQLSLSLPLFHFSWILKNYELTREESLKRRSGFTLENDDEEEMTFTHLLASAFFDWFPLFLQLRFRHAGSARSDDGKVRWCVIIGGWCDIRTTWSVAKYQHKRMENESVASWVHFALFPLLCIPNHHPHLFFPSSFFQSSWSLFANHLRLSWSWFAPLVIYLGISSLLALEIPWFPIILSGLFH